MLREWLGNFIRGGKMWLSKWNWSSETDLMGGHSRGYPTVKSLEIKTNYLISHRNYIS